MTNIINRIKIEEIGWNEFFMATIPILSMYSKGIIHLDMISCFLVMGVCFLKRQVKWFPKYYRLLFAYLVIHQIILCVTMNDVPLYHVNSTINMIIMLLSVSIISPAIDLEKFKKATYIVGIFLSIGILYHFLLLLSGNPITPLPVPIIDTFFERARGDLLMIRPVSFFEEPASYANYMLVPMFFLLKEKKYLWFSAAVFSVLLSTSTTGVVSCFLLLIFDMLLNMKNKGQVLIIGLLIGIIGYGLSTMEFFSETIKKIETTDVEKNSRMANGPYLLKNIPKEDLVFGVNASNTYDYLQQHKELYGGLITFGDDSDEFYVSNLYDMIINLGIVGLLLYFFVYFKIILDDKKVLPLVGTVAAFSIFGGAGISSTFVFVISTAVACSLHDNYYSQILTERTR